MTATYDDDLEVGERSRLIGSSVDDPEKPLGQVKGQGKEMAVAGFSAVSFGASVLAMLVERNPMVYVSGIIGAGMAPLATIQQQKITQVDALAETNERVEQEVAQLKGENDKLQAQLVTLNTSVTNLKSMQEKLKTIQSAQGASLDELETQLQESKNIYGRMELNLQGEILQNLLSVIMACDNDGDQVMDDDDIERLIHKLEGIEGVDLKDDMIRKKIVDSGRSLNAVMEVAKNLLRQDIPPEENIFVIRK